MCKNHFLSDIGDRYFYLGTQNNGKN